MNRLKQALFREMTFRNKAGAYLAALTCPCHVPMLLFLTAGTAVGAWLAAYGDLLLGLAAVLFVYGLWTMFRSGKACPRQSAD